MESQSNGAATEVTDWKERCERAELKLAEVHGWAAQKLYFMEKALYEGSASGLDVGQRDAADELLALLDRQPK